MSDYDEFAASETVRMRAEIEPDRHEVPPCGCACHEYTARYGGTCECECECERTR